MDSSLLLCRRLICPAKISYSIWPATLFELIMQVYTKPCVLYYGQNTCAWCCLVHMRMSLGVRELYSSGNVPLWGLKDIT